MILSVNLISDGIFILQNSADRAFFWHWNIHSRSWNWFNFDLYWKTISLWTLNKRKSLNTSAFGPIIFSHFRSFVPFRPKFRSSGRNLVGPNFGNSMCGLGRQCWTELEITIVPDGEYIHWEKYLWEVQTRHLWRMYQTNVNHSKPRNVLRNGCPMNIAHNVNNFLYSDAVINLKYSFKLMVGEISLESRFKLENFFQ